MINLKGIFIFLIIASVTVYITKNNNSTEIIDNYFSNFKEYLYLIYINIRERNINDNISIGSLTLFYILIPFIIYIYVFSSGEIINKYYNLITISIFLIMFSLFSLYILFKKHDEMSNNNSESKSNLLSNINSFKNLSVLLILIYFSLQIFINISYYWLLISLKDKLLLFIIGFLVMGLIYNIILKKILTSQYTPSFIILIVDILFYLPCLFTDLSVLFLEKYFNLQKPIQLLLIVTVIIILFYYIIPFLLQVVRKKDTINILNSNKAVYLDNYNKKNHLVFLNKYDINKIRLQFKSPLQKKIINENIELQKYLDKYKTNNNKLILNKESVELIKDPNENVFYIISDIIITYTYDKYEELKDYLKDTFDIGIDLNFVKHYQNYLYGLEYNNRPNTQEDDPSKYGKLIHHTGSSHYNDISDNITYKEGFSEDYNPDLHVLDKKIDFYRKFKYMSDDDKYILNDIVDEDVSVLFKRLDYDDEKINDYLYKLLKSDKNINKVFNKIKKLNKKTNNYIYSYGSSIVNLINYYNNIKDIYYHYGLSFWIYFDTNLLNNSNKDTYNNKYGLIMNYSNNPIIKYDYNTSELIVSIEQCKHSKYDDEYDKCEEIIIYKTKNIEYQKWNLFTVNYDYGILDIFINNNLVLTHNLTPYIKNNKLFFGNKNEPLYNSGICNILYKEIPFSKKEIKKLYSNKNNPCI